jgi:hypothetical protein
VLAADCGGNPVQVQRRCLHEFLARQLRDRLLVISKSATIIMAPRHHNGVLRHSLTDRLRARLGRLNKIEIRMTGSMSPRAKATLAAMRMAFRAANVARSFGIGHLALFFRLRRNREMRLGSRASPVRCSVEITPVHRRD